MSTRGYISWTINGRTTFTYNHCDSYPAGLGVQVLDALHDPALTPQALACLRQLDELADATPADIAAFSAHRRSVSTDTDNYSLLRDLQGDLQGMIKAGVVAVIDGPSNDGEYGYELDYDAPIPTFTVTVNDYPTGWRTLATYQLDALPTQKELVTLS